VQVKCIKAFGPRRPGDVVDVPDGAAVDPVYFEPAGAAVPAPAAAAPGLAAELAKAEATAAALKKEGAS